MPVDITKRVFEGDSEKSRSMVGISNVMLYHLKAMEKLSGLKTSALFRVLEDGTAIKVSASYGVYTASVYAPGTAGVAETKSVEVTEKAREEYETVFVVTYNNLTPDKLSVISKLYLYDLAGKEIRVVDTTVNFASHFAKHVAILDKIIYVCMEQISIDYIDPSFLTWKLARYSLEGKYLGYFEFPRTPFYPYKLPPPSNWMCITPGALDVRKVGGVITAFITDIGYSGFFTRYGSGVYAFNAVSGELLSYFDGIGDTDRLTHFPHSLATSSANVYIVDQDKKIKRYNLSLDVTTMLSWSCPSDSTIKAITFSGNTLYAFVQHDDGSLRVFSYESGGVLISTYEVSAKDGYIIDTGRLVSDGTYLYYPGAIAWNNSGVYKAVKTLASSSVIKTAFSSTYLAITKYIVE